MGFIHRHKLFIGIFSFLFIGLPQYIESIWSLVERLQEVEMTTQFSFDWLYLITMPIGLGMLIFIILQSRKVSKAVIVQPTQVVVAQQYSSQVRDTLDKLIQHGERLTHLMQRDDFHREQLGQNVRQWLDETEHDVWEIVPEHASHLTNNQASTKEPYTDQERLRYSGWNRQHATLRISVDRRLAQLREIRSRIQVISTEDSRGQNGEIYGVGKTTQLGQDLSQEQVAENLTFIQHLQAVAERLLKNCQGSESQSIISILQDITQKELVIKYVANDKNDKLLEQIFRLLKHQIDDFTERAIINHRETNKLSAPEISGDDISSQCNLTNRLLLDYRRLVNEILKLLDDLWMKGLLISTSPPWSVRIHRNLADNYDELMRLVTDLRACTPKTPRDLLPKDDQLSKFPRAPLVG